MNVGVGAFAPATVYYLHLVQLLEADSAGWPLLLLFWVIIKIRLKSTPRYLILYIFLYVFKHPTSKIYTGILWNQFLT